MQTIHSIRLLNVLKTWLVFLIQELLANTLEREFVPNNVSINLKKKTLKWTSSRRITCDHQRKLDLQEQVKALVGTTQTLESSVL